MNKEEAINEIKYAKSFGTSGIVPRWEAIDTVLNYIEKLENMYNKEHNEHIEMKRQNSVLRNNERILKEKIEELEKKNKDLCENYCPKYKELENKLETQTQNYHSAYEDINWFCANYIPKQKIRDKIEELKPIVNKYDEQMENDEDTDLSYEEVRKYACRIEAYEELLEEGD